MRGERLTERGIVPGRTAASRNSISPAADATYVGFRVAQVGPGVIPTVTTWGMLALVLLVLVAGTVVIRRSVVA